MSKISTYEVAPVPKLADKLIGTSVGGEIEDVTYNFTLQELLEVFLPVIPANNLQGILDYGNTATQDINLFGTITTTYLDVTDTATFLNSYFVGDTHIQGGLFDSEDSIGLAGQVLTSTGEFVEWVTLPPIFTPTLEQVLTEGNTSDVGIILDAGLEALDVNTNTATINTNITIDGTITDGDAGVGASGNVLSSTVTGVKWVALPVYSATSPLLFNSATGVFSIQQATNSQSGYLSSSDWITFDGKQNAGNYITALTGEATASGPGSATVTLGNAAVIGKVLTGFNPIAGTINASDSILTAFGKTQSQINALVGGVLYKGTWNASANLPVLTSSVGVQGNYYVVNVAGNTNLNGITDWKIGDWAIFSESVWQKVDNTESVSSVNGFTGAVELTTDDIPEGTTNLYFLNSRARQALSFLPGSGAYDNTSGAITIPTDNNQILNGAGYITYGSLSASSPLVYNNLTGAFSIPKATSLVDGYLSAVDWSTFNGKQNYLGGTGLVKSTAGTISYITDNSSNWNTAYDRSIISAAVTGTTTKTLTLNEQDGGTITASWTDLDTGLTSVGVSMPGAFTVTNSPLTSNGTIAITGAGTTLQYIDGTGALRTFPGLTGYVPYTGATQNVDLGEFGISAGYFQADLTPTGALQVGRMQWNNTDGTMDLRLLGNNVTLQIGQENVTRVVNKSGIDLLEANYQVVRVRKVAEGGAQGQRLAVVLAQGNNENNSTEVIGLVTETINSNQEGFVTAFGEVKNINTTGSLQGETWVDGDILYLSDTIPGQLTKVRPIAPNHAVTVGYVTYAHVNNGKIYMAIDTGYELGELHNVYAPSPTANQSIYWNVANSRYQLNTIGGILGYTPADAATTLTINGTTYDLSANRTWNVGTVTSVAALTLGTSGTDLSSSVATGTTTPVITLNVPTASAANRGALSATDWSTFNTKVGSVTASSPLASSGGSTPNITIQQSSGSQDGYLSSTDWTTFNSKQAAGNYITSLTGEATASGPGAAAVTLNNASVTGKVLTGVNITGGTVQATDTMLTAFGKLQNQINGLIGSTIYQGTWNASTNTPALASGVGVRGYYYIVSVSGNTNLDGITDWFVGDWAIFDGTAWQQVDNTDAVVSVNGQTGAVSLTTDNIPEGVTNQYYLNSRARAALSFTAGSGAYNSTTGVITIPTNTSQLTNGANFITLASLSGTAPIQYNNTTGAISITQAGTASNGFLSSTDWNTFNNKQATITLTTTGSSGAATLVGTTLNIPTYTLSGLGGISSVSGTAPISVSTVSGAATVSIATANTTTTGALTSTDWNTFNGKQNALTNPVTGTGTNNRIVKFTTIGSTVGNSSITDDGTNVSIATSVNLLVDGDLKFTGSDCYIWTPNTITGYTGLWDSYNSKAAINYINGGALQLQPSSGNVVVGNIVDDGGSKLQVLGNLKLTGGSTIVRLDNTGGTAQSWWVGQDVAGTNDGIFYIFNATSGNQAINIRKNNNVIIGGTTDAGFKLDVNGTARVSGAATFSSSVTANAGFYMPAVSFGTSPNFLYTNSLSYGLNATGGNAGVYFGNLYNSSFATAMQFRVVDGGGANITAMTLNSNGNIGIATINPESPLEIYRSASGDAIILSAPMDTGNSNYLAWNHSKGRSLISARIGTVDDGNYGGNIVFQNRTGLGTTTTEKMRIRTDGVIWMGTTTGISGGGTLQVNGNVNINGVFQINGVTIGGGGGSGVTGAGTTNYIPKWSGSTSLGNSVMYDSGSYIGINTSSPAVKLDVYTSNDAENIFRVRNNEQTLALGTNTTSGGSFIFEYGNYAIRFGTNSSEKMRIAANGNILINRITDEGYKLDVNGTGRFTGNLTAAGITSASTITASNSITASGGFFDTSDSRLKIIIKDYNKAKGIEKIEARLYLKNNKKELGYFAQDLQEILPSAVGEATDGFLTLSYSQVHTAKIAYLEEKIVQLEEIIKSLIK